MYLLQALMIIEKHGINHQLLYPVISDGAMEQPIYEDSGRLKSLLSHSKAFKRSFPTSNHFLISVGSKACSPFIAKTPIYAIYMALPRHPFAPRRFTFQRSKHHHGLISQPTGY
ncbi:putative transcriptional regulatory protein C3C7.04 [Fusarium oxysporum f. sp. albedinis]|nr:putative transcriptional regulatory protein C3C7.04 [Fusarium oxysporum f. sp. albedinis]